MCMGRVFPLEHPGPGASQEGICFHLPGCSWPFPGGSQQLDSTSRAFVPRQLCCLSFPQQPLSQQGWQCSASPGPAQGVPCCGLWAPAFVTGCGWTLDPGSSGTAGSWAAPGLQLCSGWTTAFSGPPSSAVVRWIRDDLPLVNYITVNVSYITAVLPEIMAKILLTFWCCFMYFM